MDAPAVHLVPGLQRAIRGFLYLFREFLVIGLAKNRRFLRPVAKVAPAHLHRQVRDPGLRKALTPDYTIGCKRILISNDYFPAVAAPNAELVTAGIAEVRPHSVVTRDGVERPTDTIVLATGFSVTDLPIARRIRGREGRSLAEVWSAGMVSNRSAAVAGFPNLFLLVGPNVGVGHTSMVYMIESQVAYVDDALRTMDAEGLDGAGDHAGPQEAWRSLIAEKSKGTVWLAGGCASWYLDRHGHNTTLWPDFTFRFRRLTRTARPRELRRRPGRRPAGRRGGVTAPSGSASPPSARRTAPLLHADVDGSDDAPVTLVLAHGWTLSQAAWDDVADLLAPRVAAGELRLVRYDQRGHGRSTWGRAASRSSIDQLGADLGAVLDQLAPTGPVVLGGHSMGGMTIMCLAAARPELFGDRVRGVALVSTSAGDLAPDRRTPPGGWRQLSAGRLTAALGRGAGWSSGCATAAAGHPRHRKMVRDLLYGADATDAMVLAGAEIMHASTVRAFIAFMPALGQHDKRDRAGRADPGAGRDPGRRRATS